jgi:hypothetical protein
MEMKGENDPPSPLASRTQNAPMRRSVFATEASVSRRYKGDVLVLNVYSFAGKDFEDKGTEYVAEQLKLNTVFWAS